VVYPPTGSTAIEKEISTPPPPQMGYGTFTFTCYSKINGMQNTSSGGSKEGAAGGCPLLTGCILKDVKILRENELFFCIQLSKFF